MYAHGIDKVVEQVFHILKSMVKDQGKLNDVDNVFERCCVLALGSLRRLGPSESIEAAQCIEQLAKIVLLRGPELPVRPEPD